MLKSSNVEAEELGTEITLTSLIDDSLLIFSGSDSVFYQPALKMDSPDDDDDTEASEESEEEEG